MKNLLKSLTLVAAGGALGFVLLVAALVVTGARPWHGSQNPDVVFASGPTQAVPMGPEMQAETMHEGMMKGGMTMGQAKMSCNMMAQHEEAAKMIDQLAASFAAIDVEKDPAALKSKLTQHGILLKQLQAKSQESMRLMGSMMDKMHEDKMTCPMMGGEHQGQ